jgi:hypothetical protein
MWCAKGQFSRNWAVVILGTVSYILSRLKSKDEFRRLVICCRVSSGSRFAKVTFFLFCFWFVGLLVYIGVTYSVECEGKDK